MNIIFTSQSPSETSHHGDDAHNFLTDLDYGYRDIQNALTVAQTDPRENWYAVGDADEHVIRYVRRTNRWEVATSEETTSDAPFTLHVGALVKHYDDLDAAEAYADGCADVYIVSNATGGIVYSS